MTDLLEVTPLAVVSGQGQQCQASAEEKKGVSSQTRVSSWHAKLSPQLRMEEKKLLQALLYYVRIWSMNLFILSRGFRSKKFWKHHYY